MNFANQTLSNGRLRILTQKSVQKIFCNTSAKRFSNESDWSRIVNDAERVVGYSTSYMSLRCLLSDEISNLAVHVRKLVGTGHPLLKTAKRLIYNGKTYMHTRGLVVLLISKTAGHKTVENKIDSISDGISFRQRSLAEITEMIHMAHQIHRGIINISSLLLPDETTLSNMELGNKIAVLCGDYLLASAAKNLASLRHPDVVEMITKAIRDFPQAEFIGEHDVHGNAVSIPGMTSNDWEEKTYLLTGSLLAHSCKAALALANHDQMLQNEAFCFGKNVALAWQVYSELQPFLDTHKYTPGKPFDLTSLPVQLHLNVDAQLQDYIIKYKQNLDNVDYKLVRDAVLSGQGVDKAKEICEIYAKRSIQCLSVFNNSEANSALKNIVDVLHMPELSV